MFSLLCVGLAVVIVASLISLAVYLLAFGVRVIVRAVRIAGAFGRMAVRPAHSGPRRAERRERRVDAAAARCAACFEPLDAPATAVCPHCLTVYPKVVVPVISRGSVVEAECFAFRPATPKVENKVLLRGPS
jgi:hypothetical protein